MAIKKNLVSDREEHTRYLGNFRGVDFSSDPSEVHDSRFAECVNMYKDYRSGQGQAIETIPGFREIVSRLEGEIYGIHPFGDDIMVHAGNRLYQVYTHDGELKYSLYDKVTVWDENGSVAGEKYLIMNTKRSTSFIFNNALYIIDGKNYLRYTNHLADVLDEAFIPTTHISLTADGGPQLDEAFTSIKGTGEYTQQNILTDTYRVTYVCDGESTQYCLPLGCDEGEVGYSYVKGNEVEFPQKFDVVLYGIRIPWVTKNGAIPTWYYNAVGGQPFPTAIKSISADGVITFAAPLRIPLHNNAGYDENGNPEYHEGYELDGEYQHSKYAFPEGYAGLEVTAKKAVRTIKGITATDSNVGSIITGCNIATVHDGRVFLSGNPKFPNFVFYNGINPETGYSDPSYFGVLNWFSEGVGSAPITGLMPISNALMVLRRDTVQDGSVTFRYRHETGEDVMPVTYTADEGLPGVGCLGACCNFLDDPIFISKYGVEAMGQLSTRLERAIEHRSSLIDGLLLNLDLSKASITEYAGYLVLLIEGKIFLADSRQRYTHESGVMQYEWFYLDDIGIYEGQTEEYKYAEFPHEVAGEKIEIKEGDETVNIIEAPSELIGTVYDGNALSVSVEGKTVYYAEYTYLDGGNNSVTARYYLEPTGAMTGGTFDPAVIIKAIGDDLYFGTRGGRIGKFYFDKRDPLDDYKIPTEYYTFNGRTIRSCCVTKMDNCGVPHLNKSTVKKSMVVKMRTFPKSAVKIKVRTNRRNVRDVERLYGGRFDPDELDFFDLSYETGEKNIFRVREKEKKWVEKQLYFVSDEYCRPFSLHYVAYGYNIAGRYKD